MENNRNFIVGVIVIGLLIALAAIYNNARNNQNQNTNSQPTPTTVNSQYTPTATTTISPTGDTVSPTFGQTNPSPGNGSPTTSIVPRVSLTPTVTIPNSF